MIAAQEIQLKSSLRSSNLNLQRPGSLTLQRTSFGGQAFSQGRAAKKVGKNKSTNFDSISNLHKYLLLWIRDILVRIRIRIRILRSVPLSNGSGCGSGRPKNIRTYAGSGCGSGTLVKSHKEDTKQYKSSFFLLFLLEDERIRSLIRICTCD
jgi:hypothetical protein